MKIFPSLNDRKPKWREADESLFQFLCRSERAEARASREIIEKWAEDYPENDIERWLGNFRSSDDDQHTSAFFELFLYKFFSANLSVLAVEPPVAGVTGTPDFLIEDPVQGRFFVEAIAPSFRSKADVGRTKLVDNIKSDINKIIVQDYYLILEEISSPTEAFSTKPLLRELERWLQAERSADCKFEYRDKGACIKIGLLPRPGRDTSSPEYRAIGMEIGGVASSTPGLGLKKALETKASKYRNLPHPYFIAINARGFQDTEDDYLAATYGSDAVKIRLGVDGEEVDEPRWIRLTNGLYNDGGRARKTNVSGVVFFNGVAPWNWSDRRSCVVHNAYTTSPLFDLSFGGDAYVPEEWTLTKIEGKNVGEIFAAKRVGASEG